jgi:hypothetical protein
MKKAIFSLLTCVFIFSSPQALMGDQLDKLNRETDKLWRPGAGAEDGAFTASAMSMLGWGLGLAVAIALIAILVNDSDSSTAHSHAHCH